DEEIEQFRREAEAVARLDHPGIVPVYDVGDAGGRHFFSMKLVEGGSLTDRMAEFASPDDAAQLVESVARAVHHAHQRGILHRDVKPSNILLDREGEAYVADFGIAARLGGGGARAHTAPAGTPAYMAPEQAQADGEPTTASDCWALGCVLFELLEGDPPFHGETATDSLQLAREAPAPPLARAAATLPVARAADLQAIVHRCLRKDPLARYASARALADDLTSWRALSPVTVRTPALVDRFALRWRRHPWTSSLAAAVALMIVAIAVIAPLVSVELGARLRRAESAEGIGQARLRAALLAQGTATRQSLAPGRRSAALALFAEAAATDGGGAAPDGSEPPPDLGAIRDEAIGALALTDLVVDARAPHGAHDEAPLAVDAELRRAFVSGTAGVGRIIDLDSGEVATELLAPSGRFRSVAFGPNGRWLLARTYGSRAADDPAMSLFDLRNGEPVRTWTEGVVAPRYGFDGEGRRIALVRDDHTLTAFALDAVTGTVEAKGEPVQLTTHPSRLEFAPDGRAIFLATDVGRSVERVDLARGEISTIAGDLPYRTAILNLDPTGERVLVGFYGPEAQLLDARTGALLARFRGHDAEVIEVEFVTESLVATSAWDGLVRVWDADDATQVYRWPGRVLLGGRGASGRIVTIDDRDFVRRRVSRPRIVRALEGHAGKSPRAVASPVGGAWVATGAVDGLRLWDPRTGALLRHFDCGEVLSLVAAPGGEAIWVSVRTGVTRYDVGSLRAGEDGEPAPLVEGWTEDLALSADGSRIAVMRPRDGVEVFAVGEEPPRRVATMRGPGRIARLSLTGDGGRLVAGAWRGRGIRAWNASTGDVLFDRLGEHRQAAATFDATGDRVLAGVPDALVAYAPDGRELRRATLENERSFSSAGPIATDAAGRWIAAVVDRGTVELRDPATLGLCARLRLDGTPTQSLRFVPASDLLLAGLTDGRALVWDLGALEDALVGIGVGLR
ncbi:MAG: WD40 repeat domain-containing serine/threonine-protein kinase, partial [Planctomycetota bacterium]